MRSNMNLGMPKNIIKVGSVREHGCRVEVKWKREALGNDGMPELFRGVGKESRKFSSSMGDRAVSCDEGDNDKKL